MSHPGLAHARTLLETYRELFRGHAGEDLHLVVISSPEERQIDRWSDSAGSEPDESETPLPLPLHLGRKPELTRYRLMRTRPVERDLLYLGDLDCLRAYREIARPAAQVLAAMLGPLSQKVTSELLRATLDDVGFINVHLAPMAFLGDDAAWSLAVHGLLDEADQGMATLVERWIWDGSHERPAPLYERETGGSVELLAVQRYGILSSTLTHDVFTSSIIAVDKLLDMATEPARPRERLAIGSDGKTVTLDGKVFVIDDRGTFRAYRAIVEANGQIVPGSKLPLQGRIDRKLKTHVPVELRATYESKNGNGGDYCLLPEYCREEVRDRP